MSKVSGVVLTVTVCERNGMCDAPPVVEINEWLTARGFGALKDVTEFAGGSKWPQITIYAAGLNYLEEDEFAAFVRSRAWQYPANAVLIINPEEGPARVFQLEGEAA